MRMLISGLPPPICQGCGKQIKRARGGTVAMWQARKNCDVDCLRLATAKKKAAKT
jgi:hypothetical protein